MRVLKIYQLSYTIIVLNAITYWLCCHKKLGFNDFMVQYIIRVSEKLKILYILVVKLKLKVVVWKAIYKIHQLCKIKSSWRKVCWCIQNALAKTKVFLNRDVL